MRPVPIPDELVPEGAVRQVVAGPDGDLTGAIRPVDALFETIDLDADGSTWPCVSIRLELDPGDLERLQADPHVWLRLLTNRIPPFIVELAQRCRVCGCTDDKACIDLARGGEPCSWVGEDLCSRCART